MTKQEFLAAYREHVVACHAWADNAAKLAHFMKAVETTLYTERTAWAWDGTGTKIVWKDLGGKGRPTLKALRGLPA
jgi:hypothetical protein